MLDYSVFQGVPLPDPAHNGNPNQKYLYPSRALFAVTADGGLRALAVQCGDQTWDAESGAPAPPVFTPPPASQRSEARWRAGSLTDAERARATEWAMAKTCVQVAEASHFELATHLGRTHLVANVFSVAMHRKLPAGHPVKRLLGAHLEGTIAINEQATGSLINQGGAIDQAFAPNITDGAALAVAAANAYLSAFHSSRFDRKMARNGLPTDMTVPLR